MKMMYAALALAVLATGCGKTANDATTDIPNLPDRNTMEIPAFITTGTAKAALGKAAGTLAPGDTTYTHVSMAVLGVTYWTVNFNLALLPPRFLFWNSFSVDPTELDNGDGWQWDVNYGIFTARLVGKPLTDSTSWEMYVTGGDLNDFMWYDGISTGAGMDGHWTFYDTSSTGTPLAKFLITYDKDAPTKFIRAEVIDPADTCYGNFVEWTATGDERAFHIYDAANTDPSQPDSISVTWNDIYEYGSINDLKADTSYCWDTKDNGHKDVDCTPVMQ